MHNVALLWLIFTWNMGATTNLWQGIGYLTTDPVCNCFAACSMLHGILWGKHLILPDCLSREKLTKKTRVLTLAQSWATVNDYRLIPKRHLALDNLTKLFVLLVSFTIQELKFCRFFSIYLTLTLYVVHFVSVSLVRENLRNFESFFFTKS